MNADADGKLRCEWATKSKLPLERHYHDTEWGVPVHDDLKHFEMLILEGAQAGLSWATILKMRQGYQRAFAGFNPRTVAAMRDADLEALLLKPGIVRNRLKVFSARKNAVAFLAIQDAFGSYDAYVWRFVNGAPQVRRPKTRVDIPAQSAESDALSKDLKKRGMSFVGSTIIYAYLQAVGMVNDHVVSCFCCPP